MKNTAKIEAENGTLVIARTEIFIPFNYHIIDAYRKCSDSDIFIEVESFPDKKDFMCFIIRPYQWNQDYVIQYFVCSKFNKKDKGNQRLSWDYYLNSSQQDEVLHILEQKRNVIS